MSERLQRREALRLLALEGPLCVGATQVVPGEGDPFARIVLVGEAPGGDEDRLGRPFVGRAGKLLDQILEAAGLDRSGVWITNAVKCRPVQAEAGRLRNRAPTAAEVRAWAPVLHDELKLIRPAFLVGLGAVAAKALASPNFSITRERGSWFQDRILGVPALVTWHPAYLLRQTGESYELRRAEAIADLTNVRERMERGSDRI